jgi:hypothetical protein
MKTDGMASLKQQALVACYDIFFDFSEQEISKENNSIRYAWTVGQKYSKQIVNKINDEK